MKCFTTSPIDSFAPITLSITIETRDELVSLWHRMNDNNKDIKVLLDLWNLLDSIAKERGISTKEKV